MVQYKNIGSADSAAADSADPDSDDPAKFSLANLLPW
jgi:hypothetical protein